MRVEGRLVVNGTAVEPVSFEAFDNTPGAWSSLHLHGGTGLLPFSIEHASFSCAIQSLRLENNGTIVSLAEVDFRSATQADIAISGNHAPTVSGGLSGSRITSTGGDSTPLNVSGGVFRHSNSPGEFEMGVSLVLGGIYHLRLDSTSAFDFMTAERSVTIGAATLDLDVTGLSAAPGNSFRILDKTSAGAINGTFNGLAEGTRFQEGAFEFQITYAGGDGNDVVLSVVPEPTAALLLLFSAIPLSCRRNRTAS